MRQFNLITKYIPLLRNDFIGKWHFEENDGLNSQLRRFPYVEYSQLVHNFIHDVYTIVEEQPELELVHYQEILQRKGISSLNHDVSTLDAQSIMALIVYVIRNDRFEEGILLEFIQNGNLIGCLERLAIIDG